jgi:hypothetical protein
MIDQIEIRDRFAAFAGTEVFRRFVSKLNKACRWQGRLLFWQEDLWKQFVDANPGIELTFDEIEKALRICELHECELQVDPQGLSASCKGAVNDWVMAQGPFSPNLDCGPSCPGGAPGEYYHFGMWFCPECRNADKEWRERHGYS